MTDTPTGAYAARRGGKMTEHRTRTDGAVAAGQHVHEGTRGRTVGHNCPPGCPLRSGTEVEK